MVSRIVSSGITSSGLTLGAADTLTVLGGGSALLTTLAGGADLVSSGGVATSTTIRAGGLETVLSGGIARGAIVSSGGTQLVSGTASGTVVNSGGVQVAIGSVATVSGTVINSGGRMVLSNFFAVNTPVLNLGGTIDMPTLTFVSSGNARLATSSLTVAQGGSANTFALAGSYGTDLFEMAPDGSGGTLITRIPGYATSGAVVSSGWTYFVSTGMTVTSATLQSGGRMQTFSGGIGSGTQVQGGAQIRVSSGGLARGDTISSAGLITVSSGGAALLATVAGGSAAVLSGGVATSTTVSSGGLQTISAGGIASATRIHSGGQETVLSGGTARSTFVSNGGTQHVSGTASGTVILSGGVQIAIGAAASVIGTVVSSGGTLVLSNFFAVNQPILNPGGFIDIPALAFVSSGSATLTSGTLVVQQGGSTDSFALAGLYGTDVFTMLPGTFGGTMVTRSAAPPCFLQGTRIATPGGEVPVEQLAPGMRVRTAHGQEATVIWTGHRRIAAERDPRPLDVMPILVRPHAFGPGQPRRELWLSPDHAVFADGMLVPIRYLINGCTIVQQHRAAVTYWHVELARHDVLLADGLPCESYLDTGNRDAFIERDRPARVLDAAFIWATQACAPLVMAGPALARLRAALLSRLPALGYAVTEEPEAQLLADGRIALTPQMFGDWICVALPDGTRTLHLASRSAAPAHLEPAANDSRPLGVAIAGLRINGSAVPLDHPRFLHGWHMPEPDLRWTNGAGALDCTDVNLIELCLAHGLLRYAVPPGQPRGTPGAGFLA